MAFEWNDQQLQNKEGRENEIKELWIVVAAAAAVVQQNLYFLNMCECVFSFFISFLEPQTNKQIKIKKETN